jgi:hypothetical protein
MDKHIVVPIVLFLCVTYAFKAVLDAYVRRRIVNCAASPEIIQAALEREDSTRRHSALRWGLVLLALAIGFGLLDAWHLQDVTTGAIAILLGMTGLGHLAYVLLARRLV